MSGQELYYLNKLYPLQDDILLQLKGIESKFYLTGGTVASRFMLHHRYSDDLDFFLNNDQDFITEAEKIINTITQIQKWNIEVSYRSSSFYRIIICFEDIKLKADLVNDVGFHAGAFISNALYHKIDNERNILSNKITALQRDAPKDMADILFLSFNYPFNWMQIIEDSKQKDTWVNEVDIGLLVDSYDEQKLKEVKWTKEPDLGLLKNNLDIIARDILMGGDNSLCKNAHK